MVSYEGWMSDYDVLLLYSRVKSDGLNLLNNRRFTCYSHHVPNLVSRYLDNHKKLGCAKLVSQAGAKDLEVYFVVFWINIFLL